VRISLSINFGFRLASIWPNQYTNGRRADDVKAVGADVAEEPNGFAGVEVGIGILTGQADIVPGTVHPPCMMSTVSNSNITL
jgi:hypothetical protein